MDANQQGFTGGYPDAATSRALYDELDYQREAANLRTIAENLREFSRIHVPSPVADYTTRSVLTMEYVAGQKITQLTPLARIELDGSGLAEATVVQICTTAAASLSRPRFRSEPRSAPQIWGITAECPALRQGARDRQVRT